MFSNDLRNWSIFSLLKPNFIPEIHMALVYGNLGNEAIIVTKDDMVYALGSNTCGCLGTGDNHSTLYPKKVLALCKKGIKTFACGKGPHVLALTKEGQVYSWGHNGYCELGNGTSTQGVIPSIVGINLNAKLIEKIACGSHHSLALTFDGEVYAWGQNGSGQVGSNTNNTLSVQNTPRKVNSFGLNTKKVICISCGDSSSVVVTDNGEVYSWGHNGVGQLGIGNYLNQSQPCKVTALTGVVIEKVVCGYMHTLALSDEGILYVWGANTYGQLGLNKDINFCTPIKLEVPEMGKVLDIAASHYNHISVGMGKRNRIFMWGQCLGQTIKIPTLTPVRCLHDAFAYYASPRVMHRPLILQGDEETNLIDSVKKAFDDSTTSDLIIEVHGKPICVHKAILKVRCHYFRTMFQEHWAENSQSVIKHEQFSYEAYKAFLKYLYTNEIDLPHENMLELLELANAYSESQLKKRCIQVIKRGITVTNVAFLYSTSIAYNAKELEECCFKFALAHMNSVILTENFAKLDGSTVKTFIIKAAKAGAFKT